MAERSKWAPGADVLAESARAICAVAAFGRSSEDALHPQEGSSHRASVRAITLGSLRWYLRLVPAIEALLTRPAQLDPALHALLIAAAHQIEYSRNAPQLTVHAAVDATRVLGLGRASSLANAVLRRFVAERHSLLEQADQRLEVRTAHPGWLVERLRAVWPAQVESILAANNMHPPMVLRVNRRRIEVEDYLRRLKSAGLQGTPCVWAPAAVQLQRSVPVSELPGFAEGEVSVQDAGAQLAATLLAASPGMRVLDLCAAPGGKTGHILELGAGAVQVSAVDRDPLRSVRIEENLARLGEKATVIADDAREYAAKSQAERFDRVLVDAPCSSTGVIRRHPDIKLLRRAQDVDAFAVLQGQILHAAYELLAPGGRLIYCTCSVLPEENEAVAAKLLAAHPGAKEVRLRATQLAPGALERPLGMQLLPGAEAGTDGFYYACLEKTTTGT